MSTPTKEDKKITMGFTEEGHKKLKEMSKRYGVLTWMMLDAMIDTVDEQSEEFKKRIGYWQQLRGTKKMSEELAQALSEAQLSLSESDLIALIKKHTGEN